MTYRIRLTIFFIYIGQLAFPFKVNPTSTQDTTVYGKVIGIADGDTITLLIDNTTTTIKVRLASIDCPERKQPYASVAKQFVSDEIFNREVKVKIDSKDRYGRSIGWVYYNNKCLNQELLKQGLAWHFRMYSKDKKLQILEDHAKATKVGLWKGQNPIPPWEWRKGVRN